MRDIHFYSFHGGARPSLVGVNKYTLRGSELPSFCIRCMFSWHIVPCYDMRYRTWRYATNSVLLRIKYWDPNKNAMIRASHSAGNKVRPQKPEKPGHLDKEETDLHNDPLAQTINVESAMRYNESPLLRPTIDKSGCLVCRAPREWDTIHTRRNLWCKNLFFHLTSEWRGCNSFFGGAPVSINF